jgi:hypothetical protein
MQFRLACMFTILFHLSMLEDEYFLKLFLECYFLAICFAVFINLHGNKYTHCHNTTDEQKFTHCSLVDTGNSVGVHHH